MRIWVPAIIVGIMGAMCCASLVAGTGGDFGSITPISIPSNLQFPGLIFIGILAGLALRDFARSGIAYGISVLLGSVIYGAALTIPGFTPSNYTNSRFNHGIFEGFILILFASVLILVGMLLAFGFNIYTRRVDA